MSNRSLPHFPFDGILSCRCDALAATRYPRYGPVCSVRSNRCAQEESDERDADRVRPYRCSSRCVPFGFLPRGAQRSGLLHFLLSMEDAEIIVGKSRGDAEDAEIIVGKSRGDAEDAEINCG